MKRGREDGGDGGSNTKVFVANLPFSVDWAEVSIVNASAVASAVMFLGAPEFSPSQALMCPPLLHMFPQLKRIFRAAGSGAGPMLQSWPGFAINLVCVCAIGMLRPAGAAVGLCCSAVCRTDEG